MHLLALWEKAEAAKRAAVARLTIPFTSWRM